MAKIRGTVVTATPQKKQAKSELLQPGDEARPGRDADNGDEHVEADRFMNHTVGDGIRPNVGRTERSQPKKRPEISAPPEVDRVSGTLPIL